MKLNQKKKIIKGALIGVPLGAIGLLAFEVAAAVYLLIK